MVEIRVGVESNRLAGIDTVSVRGLCTSAGVTSESDIVETLDLNEDSCDSIVRSANLGGYTYRLTALSIVRSANNIEFRCIINRSPDI